MPAVPPHASNRETNKLRTLARFVSVALPLALGSSACASGAEDRDYSVTPADADDEGWGGSAGSGGAGEDGGLPSDFGLPCTEPSQCSSGLCVEGPDGGICTVLCSDSCPDGYACVRYDGLSSPDDHLCMPQLSRLCRPCETDADCHRAGVVDDKSRCVTWGDRGSFCGVSCQNDPCPAGYFCEDVTVGAGSTERHCVLGNSETCECRPSWADLGLKTACSISNTHGSCTGIRECSAGGLSDCDAATPLAEVCDGADNNCSGAVDEGACDDGHSCTDDVCDGEGGCDNTLQQDTCFIDDECHAAGSINLPGSCEVCDPSQSQTGWSIHTGACDDGDACSGNDTCTNGTCSGIPLQDSNEPNDSSSAAKGLSNASDCDTFPTGSITGTVYGPGDEDWFSYHVSDDFLCWIYPSVRLTVPAGAAHDLCLYLTCDDGSTPSVSCLSGVPSTSGGMNGCCSENAGSTQESVRIDHDCPGSGEDDAAQMFVRVFNDGESYTCGSYTLDYGDD